MSGIKYKHNSYLKVPTCKCGCGKVQTPSCLGYFYAHIPEELKEKVGTRKQVQIKNRNKRTALGRKLHADQKRVDKATEGTPAWKIELFFHAAAIELANKPYCENCGAFIHLAYYRAATAHVMPKKKEFGFPSIAANPINRIFLGAGCGCHQMYDSSWDNARRMSIWSKVVGIFKELYPYIAVEELKNIPNILLETLKEPTDSTISQKH